MPLLIGPAARMVQAEGWSSVPYSFPGSSRCCLRGVLGLSRTSVSNTRLAEALLAPVAAEDARARARSQLR